MTPFGEIRAVGGCDRALRLEVGEQGDRQFEAVAKRCMAEMRVDADPDERGTPLLDLRQDLLVDGELIGADGTEVERVEGEDEPAAGEVGGRDIFAILIGEGELGCGGSGLDHARTASSE